MIIQTFLQTLSLQRLTACAFVQPCYVKPYDTYNLEIKSLGLRAIFNQHFAMDLASILQLLVAATAAAAVALQQTSSVSASK